MFIARREQNRPVPRWKPAWELLVDIIEVVNDQKPITAVSRFKLGLDFGTTSFHFSVFDCQCGLGDLRVIARETVVRLPADPVYSFTIC